MGQDKTQVESLIDTLANEIGTRAGRIATETINEALAEKQGSFMLGWLEEDLAVLLGCSTQTLYLKRKNKEIGYTTTPGGKIFYMVHHVVDHLLKHEVRAANATVDLADVLQFKLPGTSVTRETKTAKAG